MLLTINRIKRNELSDALYASLKAKRKDLETMRSKLMDMAVQKRTTTATIQKEMVTAAAVTKDAAELMRMAKPFLA